MQLRQELKEQKERENYDKLQTMERDRGTCESVAYLLSQAIAYRNASEIKKLLPALGSCGNCNVNYRAAKFMVRDPTRILDYNLDNIEKIVWKFVPAERKIDLFRSIDSEQSAVDAASQGTLPSDHKYLKDKRERERNENAWSIKE